MGLEFSKIEHSTSQALWNVGTGALKRWLRNSCTISVLHTSCYEERSIVVIPKIFLTVDGYFTNTNLLTNWMFNDYHLSKQNPLKVLKYT